MHTLDLPVMTHSVPTRRFSELDRSSIGVVFETTLLERFVVTARSRANYAGKQPKASGEQQQRRRLSARQDDIAHRDLIYGARLENPLVISFETAAEDDRPQIGRAHV